MSNEDGPTLPADLQDQVITIFFQGGAVDRPTALEQLCDEHPDHAAAIRDCYRDLGGAEAALGGAVDAAAAIATPEVIGPYRVVDVLGEGGMGTVFLAHQDEPIQRDVALKVVKLGMDTKRVLARFEAERQALAMMNHDHIARVYDAGATDRGQPYFVMEHVPGPPITSHCDREQLGLEDRLKLFQQVCGGVQHAHHKGVIHRDIKPTNVLVAKSDGRAVPKIIDFGLARATDNVAFAATMVTEESQILGTPEYMSPEQADPSVAEVDTRTDIYSLGVLLYELLVGSRPFSDEQLRKAGPAEMQRTIREVDPPRPSTKITTVARSSAIAEARRTTPKVLQRVLRNDLDWVVLKAMEKEPDRRYESAAALAVDLQRFLANEPVSAGPPSAAYRFRKFIRRNRGRVAAAAVVLLTLLVGVFGTTWFAITADQRNREFDMLAQAVHLDTAKVEEAGLYPAWPEKLDEMRDWLALRARPLLERRQDLRATLESLRSRARPRSDADRIADRQSHPRFGEHLRLKTELGTLRAAHRVRQGADPLTVELGDAVRAESAIMVNSMAWQRVGPDRHIFGREAEGLAMARYASERVEGPLRAWVLDSLAWACFANGLDDEALRAGRAALAEAPPESRDNFEAELRRLEQAIADAGSEAGQAAVDELAQTVATLESELREQRTWRFDDPADEFLHETLAELIDEIDRFETDVMGPLEQRRDWAELVSERSIEAHAEAWSGAREAVAAPDSPYSRHPIDLPPQMGLVPIGANPVTGLWEFYHLRSATDHESIPEHLADGTIEVTEDTGIVFVLIPGGTFVMGAQKDDPNAPNYDPNAGGDELPHTVTLAPFLLAKHEMTQGQWMRLSGRDTPSFYRIGDRPDAFTVTAANPVEQVNWPECDQLMTQHGLLLPTEAQWEYACRAGTDTPFWTGTTAESLDGCVNVADATAKSATPWTCEEAIDDGHVVHAAVGSFKANRFGLHDMHGNAWEWCRDWHGSYGFPVREGDGLRLVPDGAANARSYRGGGFSSRVLIVRAADRSDSPPEFRFNDIGLRPSRTIR